MPSSFVHHPILRKRIHLLPEPIDFFSGLKSPTTAALPRNVLCFHRTSGKELASNQSFHHHHRHVLIVNLSGPGTVFVDDEMVRFHPSEALLIRAFQFHHYVIPPKKQLHWLFITFELDPPFAGTQVHAPLPPGHPATRSLEFFFDSYLAGRNGDPGSAEASGFLLGATLAQVFPASQSTRNPSAHPSSPQLFARIRENVRSNPAIKIDELSRRMSLSESTLRRRFRDAGGHHLGAYLIELKFNLALNELRLRKLSLTEISFRAGYQSSQAFSRAFRSRTGMSPRDYRKRIA